MCIRDSNIPDRPVFGVVGAVLFWVGVALALGSVGSGVRNRVFKKKPGFYPPADASAFLLIWWLGGIAPAVLSVPPASLGHVILAQPAFYLLAALPVGVVAGWARWPARRRHLLACLLYTSRCV